MTHCIGQPEGEERETRKTNYGFVFDGEGIFSKLHFIQRNHFKKCHLLVTFKLTIRHMGCTSSYRHGTPLGWSYPVADHPTLSLLPKQFSVRKVVALAPCRPGICLLLGELCTSAEQDMGHWPLESVAVSQIPGRVEICPWVSLTYRAFIIHAKRPVSPSNMTAYF